MSAIVWRPPVTEAATLLLCAHGARGVAGAAARHARAIGRRGLFRTVEACALYGEPRLEAVLGNINHGPLTVLPFMMAEGYTLEKLAGRLAASRPDARLLPPLGGRAAMANLLVGRALKGLRAHDRVPAETALLLVGHGTTRHRASAETALRHAAAIRARGLFSEVAVAFLDEAPAVGEAVAGLRAPFIAAVGFLTDAGMHGAGDVAPLLAATGQDGVYLGPIGPDPAVVPLILDQLSAQ